MAGTRGEGRRWQHDEEVLPLIRPAYGGPSSHRSFRCKSLAETRQWAGRQLPDVRVAHLGSRLGRWCWRTAMNTLMWRRPATRGSSSANCRRHGNRRGRGIAPGRTNQLDQKCSLSALLWLAAPEDRRLACGDVGVGVIQRGDTRRSGSAHAPPAHTLDGPTTHQLIYICLFPTSPEAHLGGTRFMSPRWHVPILLTALAVLLVGGPWPTSPRTV